MPDARTARMLKAAAIKSLDREFNSYVLELARSGKIRNPNDLIFTDHLSQRLIERNLVKDIPFIKRMAVNFMSEHFYKSTYSNRKYVVEFARLQVGMNIQLGTWSGVRMVAVTTAFENRELYECDEVIKLK